MGDTKMSIYRRYQVCTVTRCPSCGGITIIFKALGGAPGDPIPPAHQAPEPKNVNIHKSFDSPEAAAEAINAIFMQVMGKRMGDEGADTSLPDLHIELTPEEYEAEKPINIGDVYEMNLALLKK